MNQYHQQPSYTKNNEPLYDELLGFDHFFLQDFLDFESEENISNDK